MEEPPIINRNCNLLSKNWMKKKDPEKKIANPSFNKNYSQKNCLYVAA